jgi:hypothetical protein
VRATETQVMVHLSQWLTGFIQALQTEKLEHPPNDTVVLMDLIKFFRLNVDDSVGKFFIANVFSILKPRLKKKAISESFLVALSHFACTVSYDEDILWRLRKIGSKFRKDKQHSLSAVVLLVAVTFRVRSLSTELPGFSQAALTVARLPPDHSVWPSSISPVNVQHCD